MLSRELEKLNIEHNAEELMCHCAIGFGYGKRYFNTEDRIEKLNHWLDKVFNAELFKKQHSITRLKKMKKHILQNCCGVN